MSTASEVAKALESCDWSGVPIGSKAIIAQAIELLSAQQAEPVARDVLMAALDDLDNEVVNNHGIGMPFELRQKIADRHAAKLPAVPDGYALVPIDPTEEMLAAGQQEWLDSAGADPSFDIYRAMLAASQKP